MNMMNLRCAIVGMGFQLGIAAVVSGEFVSPMTARKSNDNNIPAMMVGARSGSGRTTLAAFATATRPQSSRLTNVIDRHAEFTLPSVYHSIAPRNGISASTATRLLMLPTEYNADSLAFSLSPALDYVIDLMVIMLPFALMAACSSFLLTNRTRDVRPSRDPQLSVAAASASGGEGSRRRADSSTALEYSASDDNELLTPETFATSASAEDRVEEVISTKAGEAFLSTDFEREPKLSPELEMAETAFEAALLADAAHGLADMAEKENRQSKAAMLERERESEWVETHCDDEEECEILMEAEALMAEIEKLRDDNDISGVDASSMNEADAYKASLTVEPEPVPELSVANSISLQDDTVAKQKREIFQRSLLSARIANDARLAAVNADDECTKPIPDLPVVDISIASQQKQEIFQRSLLSARITYDAKLAIANAQNKYTVKGQKQERFQRSLLSTTMVKDANSAPVNAPDVDTTKEQAKEAFQRALLSCTIVNHIRAASIEAQQRREAFNRSLLSARIANDAAAVEYKIQEEMNERHGGELLGSEVRAASMGGQESVHFDDIAAASSAAAHAFQRSLLSARIANDAIVRRANAENQRDAFQQELLAERFAHEAMNKHVKEEWLGSEVRAASMGGPEYQAFDVTAAQALAEAEHNMDEKEDVHYSTSSAAERMLVSEDVALDVANLEKEEAKDEFCASVSQQDEKVAPLSVVEVQSYVRSKGIEQTKRKIAVDDFVATSSKANSSVEDVSYQKNTLAKRTHGGLLKIWQKKRVVVVAAMAFVIGKRLVQAYLGNTLRLG